MDILMWCSLLLSKNRV